MLSPAERHRACWDPEVQTQCETVWFAKGSPRLGGQVYLQWPYPEWQEIKVLLLSGSRVSVSGCRETQQWRRAFWMQTRTRSHLLRLSSDLCRWFGPNGQKKKTYNFLGLCCSPQLYSSPIKSIKDRRDLPLMMIFLLFKMLSNFSDNFCNFSFQHSGPSGKRKPNLFLKSSALKLHCDPPRIVNINNDVSVGTVFHSPKSP